MHEPDDIEPFYTDVEELIRKFEKQVGFIVIDPGIEQEVSSVVDMTGGEIEVVRQGRKEVDF